MHIHHSADVALQICADPNGLLTFVNYRSRMIRPTHSKKRVTLMLQDVLGQDWPLYMSANCAIFVGRYRRVENFGPKSGLLHFLPGQVA